MVQPNREGIILTSCDGECKFNKETLHDAANECFSRECEAFTFNDGVMRIIDPQSLTNKEKRNVYFPSFKYN
jgi:hypothetical protein